MLSWLKRHEALASWIQAIGVVAAISFGMVQLHQARQAIEATVTNNEIALRNSASDLLVHINEAALSHPELAGNYSGHKRLHLIRLHYFYRTYQLREAGLLDDDTFAAEEQYLTWAAKLSDFPDVWEAFRLQYPPGFRAWADGVIHATHSHPARPSDSASPTDRAGD
jgi:hypothetical protein